MDVRRYYALGTVSKLGARAEDFGFAPEDDSVSKPTIDGEAIFELIASDADQCSLDFQSNNKVYYQWLSGVPDVVVNMEIFATKPMKLAYPYAQFICIIFTVIPVDFILSMPLMAGKLPLQMMRNVDRESLNILFIEIVK